MLRNAIVICLFAVVVLCIGCSEQATNLKLSDTSQPAIAAHNCPTPDCFFERYPENWEYERYQRQLMHKYQQQQLAQK